MQKNILIIEDDEFFRDLLNKKLSTNDFKVLEEMDGESGVAKIKEIKPDLVLLDLLLPNMDGFEVLMKVKADPSVAKTPIIVLSNLGQQEDIDRAMKLGASDYLIKSQLDIDQVIEKIKGMLKA
jgi:DNA-binding response OmpR family regulator